MPKHMKPLANKPSYCQNCQHNVQKTIDKERNNIKPNLIFEGIKQKQENKSKKKKRSKKY